jgi:hypothetical protein
MFCIVRDSARVEINNLNGSTSGSHCYHPKLTFIGVVPKSSIAGVAEAPGGGRSKARVPKRTIETAQPLDTIPRFC